MIADYLKLITSEHRSKPKFEAMVSAVASSFVDQQTLLTDLSMKFDIDTATGAQLDIIGLWIGRSRNVAIPLTGVYFDWDGTSLVGWDSGTWQDVCARDCCYLC